MRFDQIIREVSEICSVKVISTKEYLDILTWRGKNQT